jgi:hypothetical protein
MRHFPPLAVFTLFCLGLEAIVGMVLGMSNGLSELHKTVLVGFIVGFPALTLLIFLIMLARGDRAESAPFRHARPEGKPEPLTLSPVNKA